MDKESFTVTFDGETVDVQAELSSVKWVDRLIHVLRVHRDLLGAPSPTEAYSSEELSRWDRLAATTQEPTP